MSKLRSWLDHYTQEENFKHSNRQLAFYREPFLLDFGANSITLLNPQINHCEVRLITHTSRRTLHTSEIVTAESKSKWYRSMETIVYEFQEITSSKRLKDAYVEYRVHHPLTVDSQFSIQFLELPLDLDLLEIYQTIPPRRCLHDERKELVGKGNLYEFI